ncbi:MAG: TrkH family potassium uptake protein [Rhodobacteraceae bacterium]|nr:MAG: TrkH family potassium uptake protein [Paracoccaceae bacterium]
MLLARAPAPAVMLLVIAAGMPGPALLAIVERDWSSAQAFLQSAGLVAVAALGVGVALSERRGRTSARDEILLALFFFGLAPLAAAVPVWMATPDFGLGAAWFEMVSTFTTTGMTALPDPAATPRPVHLWRAMTAWLGGLGALMAAAAVFAPRNLGGYEVRIETRAGSVGRLAEAPVWSGAPQTASVGARLIEAARVVAPVYFALTVVLFAVFASLGKPDLAALTHAAGVMSTSGITTAPGAFSAQGGVGAEAAAALFLLIAATRHAFRPGDRLARIGRLRGDPELHLAAVAVGLAAAWIVLAHWTAPFGRPPDVASGLRDLWGAAFTALSFLTTTGYVSGAWEASRAWAETTTSSGIMLLGLAAMGGGVASTAGGVKLLRSFALYQHGLRELDRLSQPSIADRHGRGARRVGFQGAVLAWVFVMLFLLALGAAMLALSATGLPLEQSLAAAIAALANTGPAYALAAGPGAPPVAAFGAAERTILAVVMVVGRVEVLAIVALTNPAYWRR